MKKTSDTFLDQLSEIELLALLSTAAVLRKEKNLNDLLIHSKNHEIPAVKIYEALLQTYLFAGFPSALNSLKIFHKHFSFFERAKNEKVISYQDGVETCKKIYGDKFEKLRSNINSFSPEMASWFIREGYGKVLSRKGLSLKERELCIVSILSAQKSGSQLYSHINGAFRLKAGIETIQKIITNLDFLGQKSLSQYGLNIFSEFKDKKQI